MQQTRLQCESILKLYERETHKYYKARINKLNYRIFCFLKTSTNHMYSNSAARARFESPKREEILSENTVTHHLLICFKAV